ncbi:anillin isoform X2 [Cryptotermes secundus]|uniref:anillin isoform X2 n=1 Tax=Cryptotermes secundus TaxID=105785 RepID=UPI000CD7BC67|nr:anillin isoform X2 [Cryptotermes secundus]
MLARSKARREGRNAQLMNAGLEVSMHRNPLQDYNHTQLLNVTTQVEVTASKTDGEPITSNVSVTPKKVECVSPHYEEGDENATKETINVGISEKPGCTSAIRDSARSRLRRLGALYADSQLSSPIHKTEAHFSAEQAEVENEVPQRTHSKMKSGARLAKLAMLADTIRHWEDEVSHPTAVSSHASPDPNKGSSGNDANHTTSTAETLSSKIESKPNPDQQCLKVAKTKQFMLDENTVATLEAQGFSRTQSKARLVYDYSKHSPQGEENDDKTCNIPAPVSSDEVKNKLATIQENVSETLLDSVKLLPVQGSQTPVMGMNILHSSSSNKLTSSPGKRNVLPRSTGSPCVPNVPQMGLRVGSPRKGDSSPKIGSVLHKAALFESSPTKKNSKDPTELSVAERLAMFEHNKGQALMPKAALSMPVPAKYIAGSSDGQKSIPSKVYSPGKGNRMVNSTVTQLQESVTSNTNAKTVLPPGKQSGHVVKQANKSCVADTALSPAAPSEDLPTRSSKALAQMFEQGNAFAVHNAAIENVQSERQQEMAMLLNRWNRNKQLASSKECNVNTDGTNNTTAVQADQMKQECCGPPPPPPLPTPADLLQVQADGRPPGSTPSKTSHDSNVSPLKNSPVKYLNVSKLSSSEKKKAQNCERYKGLTDMKRIKVSPPKRGHLYPCLSDIEAATETESEIPDESISDMESSDGESSRDTSFGREILTAAGIHRPLHTINQGQESQTDTSDDESADMENVGDLLEEALSVCHDSETSPSPSKKAKANHQSPQRGCIDQGRKQICSSPSTSQSHSFEYSKGSSFVELEPDSTPRKVEHIPAFVVEGNEQVPLMHTVSLYRRQQKMAVKGTPVRQVVRQPEPEPEEFSSEEEMESNKEAVCNKISELVGEVKKQEIMISQATQALNFCYSTIEFSGSAEQVEGERLLLAATHRRQAALHELQRLRIEGSLRPKGCSSELSVRGSLIISNVTLPLTRDYLHTVAAGEWCHHYMYLVRSQEQVVASQVLAATSENLRHEGGAALLFPGSVKLSGLYSDFKVTLEVYILQTNREVLPHDVKYHILGKKDGSGNKLRLTPKKLLKQESRMMRPSVESPAGPSAVRSPAFKMSGYMVFSLQELRRTQFILNKVAYSSLEGNIRLQLSTELEQNVRERGFLTMFEDVSGFGAWHRRWCLLEDAVLSYWKYPDDERKKDPIGQIDLSTCITKDVNQVSRTVCARPHTFLLTTVQPALPGDEDSLVLERRGPHTVIRHLLSADTREDRLLWCTQLNKTLDMLRAWGSNLPVSPKSCIQKSANCS